MKFVKMLNYVIVSVVLFNLLLCSCSNPSSNLIEKYKLEFPTGAESPKAVFMQIIEAVKTDNVDKYLNITVNEDIKKYNELNDKLERLEKLKEKGKTDEVKMSEEYLKDLTADEIIGKYKLRRTEKDEQTREGFKNMKKQISKYIDINNFSSDSLMINERGGNNYDIAIKIPHEMFFKLSLKKFQDKFFYDNTGYEVSYIERLGKDFKYIN